MGREVDTMDPAQRKLLEVGQSGLLQADINQKSAQK